MYYSKLFFKKDVYSVTESDLIDFFNQSPEESSILEFKSGNVTIEKIYNEVAALHNSQGGLLIIGSPIPKKDSKGKEYFEGALTRSVFKNKDWLYQKLYSKISPPPINLRIHDVKCEDSGIIQVIDIPKSVNPPHQCLDDGKYYIRFETESKFAPHGLVEALFNRRQEPIIDFRFDLKVFLKSIFPTKFNLSVFNSSSIPAINASYLMYFYNIESIVSHHRQKEFKPNMINDNLTQIIDEYQRDNITLVKGIVSNINYNVFHLQEPFVVISMAWADNMNLQKKGFLIIPKNKAHFVFPIEGDVFIETARQIDKVYVNYKSRDNDFDFSGLLNLKNKFLKNK